MPALYRIYYGKYPDAITSEIPNHHIRSVGNLNFRIEPGKPAEPKIDEVSFVLENLDHNGDEIYPRSWFETESLSEANGAVSPLQLFFRIEMPDHSNKGFTGVFATKTYGSWRETVSVTIKDPRSLIAESDVYMLKPFKFEDRELIESPSSGDVGYIGITSMFDLNGDSLQDEQLDFILYHSEYQDTWAEVIFDHPYGSHRDYQTIIDQGEPANLGSGDQVIDSSDRVTFIKIGENTIFTRIRERLVGKLTAKGYAVYLSVNIYHADNGDYQEGDLTVIERGRFFRNSDADDLVVGDTYTVTIYDYNLGFDDDILVDQKTAWDWNEDNTFINGYEIFKSGDPPNRYDISQSSLSEFSVIDQVVTSFNENLYSGYYQTPANADLFEYTKAPDSYRHAFWADLQIYGFLGKEPKEILVNLATQLNCYVYFNEFGKIVFHDRLYHEDYLPASLPPDAFFVNLEDIQPSDLGDGEYGFDSYKIEYRDRIEINNVESQEERSLYVGSDGVRNKPSLRSSSITIENYRSSDLGVPAMNDPVTQLLFRRSPDDPDYSGIPGVTDNLTDFVPTPETQAQSFAKSWKYPVYLWKISWDMDKYSGTKIGNYFWTTYQGENKVYFIREIGYNLDSYKYNILAQEVGTYNG